MFNIFNKSKPKLYELIPSGFVDIHSHILPGIDDGSKNTAESLRIIGYLNKIGFSKIIATPHTYYGLYDNTNETIVESFNLLMNMNNSNIEIYYSSEYLLDKTLFKRIEDKTILTLKDNYVLVEMSYLSKPSNLFEIIFQLQVNNYKPIIAHPERYRFMFDDYSDFIKLKDIGCKFQMNLFSITDYYGKDVRNFCNTLLKNNIIDYVGTDIHNFNSLKEFEKKVYADNVRKLDQIIESNSFFK